MSNITKTTKHPRSIPKNKVFVFNKVWVVAFIKLVGCLFYCAFGLPPLADHGTEIEKRRKKLFLLYLGIASGVALAWFRGIPPDLFLDPRRASGDPQGTSRDLKYLQKSVREAFTHAMMEQGFKRTSWRGFCKSACWLRRSLKGRHNLGHNANNFMP